MSLVWVFFAMRGRFKIDDENMQQEDIQDL